MPGDDICKKMKVFHQKLVENDQIPGIGSRPVPAPVALWGGERRYRDLEFLTPAARKRVGMNRFTNRLKIHELSKQDYDY